MEIIGLQNIGIPLPGDTGQHDAKRSTTLQPAGRGDYRLKENGVNRVNVAKYIV
jgi:hypothetical protein